jgi:glutamyl-Q tRNA(Asp) synthetase
MRVFRFAPSPNGHLHLGHALSALLNSDRAREAGGRFLLRIEDIDTARCTPQFEAGIYRDLDWLGLHWEQPVRRQSEHLFEYEVALARLTDMGLIYPAFMTRGEVKARVAAVEQAGGTWPRDPDGTPLYPEDDRHRSETERRDLMSQGLRHAFRLDMQKALEKIGGPLSWTETGDITKGTNSTDNCARIIADPSRWGDVILSRSDAASSYHLSVTVDDAAQGTTHVVRGLDLFEATAVHRVLQVLLDLPEPIYHHHRLILGPDGRKLAKSEASTGLATLRDQGLGRWDIRRLVGL